MSTSKEASIFKKVLLSRGLNNEQQRDKFLNPEYSILHNPISLPDMPIAVQRLAKAKEAGELVCIYGDYDVDGLSATALLLDAFTQFGIKSSSYIPDRFTEGYGMSSDAVKKIAKSDASLIVTVDCGSGSLEEVELANRLGLDVIVTDHHTLGDKLPGALAVINPKRHDSKYLFNDLAGVGVAFKLVCALQEKLEGIPEGQEKWLLDLVALGTTCDVVSLTDENRAMVHWGIEVSKKGRRPAFRALSKVSATDLRDIDTMTFGFRFGPRLNAVGRLETAQAGLDLLVSSNQSAADKLALELDELNSKRRAVQAEIYKQAVQLASKSDDDVLVLANKNWSHGVVGIVASKIVEKFHKPTFVIQIIGDEAKGSARSFGDVNLAEALSSVNSHIIKGGGHSMAAGVTLETAKIDEFRRAINKYYQDQKLDDQSHHALTTEDVVLDDFTGLNEKLIEMLVRLEPYGAGNTKPIFKVATRIVDYRLVGSDKKHIKLTLTDENNIELDAIGFNLADTLSDKLIDVYVYFTLELNTFRGVTKVQLNLVQVTSRE